MKLTKPMRSAIVERLIERTRAPRDAKLRNHEHALAVKLIRARYGQDVFERCRVLPEGWLRSHKNVRLEGKITQRLTPCVVDVRYPYRRGPAIRQLRAPYSVSLNEYAPLPTSLENAFDGGELDLFFDEIEGWCRDRREHEDEIEAIKTQTWAVLSAYTTVELLSKDWPEGFALLPAEMIAPPSAPGVPAPRIADLNLRIEKVKLAA